ncbi:hypothetical protein BC834DRAFT_680011 [Gloeopeniophorella convolvens]|nr:hypothetical protein BC834DRAFT_680011 [Gloeopeniophorella convolvens]
MDRCFPIVAYAQSTDGTIFLVLSRTRLRPDVPLPKSFLKACDHASTSSSFSTELDTSPHDLLHGSLCPLRLSLYVWFLPRSSENMQSVFQAKPNHAATAGQSHYGAHYGMFRMGGPRSSQALGSSWTAPHVAPALSSATQQHPSAYRFASKAPVARRSPPTSAKPSTSRPLKQKAAHRCHSSVSPVDQQPRPSPYPSASARTYHERTDPHASNHGDSQNHYDEFLASFQTNIDRMTGERGGWGF